MADYDWLYTVWLVLLLVLLCARVWVCIIRMVVRHERDKQTVSIDSDDAG